MIRNYTNRLTQCYDWSIIKRTWRALQLFLKQSIWWIGIFQYLDQQKNQQRNAVNFLYIPEMLTILPSKGKQMKISSKTILNIHKKIGETPNSEGILHFASWKKIISNFHAQQKSILQSLSDWRTPGTDTLEPSIQTLLQVLP